MVAEMHLAHEMTVIESSPHIRVTDILLLLFGNSWPTGVQTEPCLCVTCLKSYLFACRAVVHERGVPFMLAGGRVHRLDGHVRTSGPGQGYTHREGTKGTQPATPLNTVDGQLPDCSDPSLLAVPCRVFPVFYPFVPDRTDFVKRCKSV